MKHTGIVRLLFIIIGLSSLSLGFAQEKEVTANDAVVTDSVPIPAAKRPEAILGRGYTIRSKNNKFSIRFRPRIQTNLEASFDENFDKTESNIEIKNLRLNMNGHLFSPKLLFALQFYFAQSESKKIVNGNANKLGVAALSYMFNDTWLVSVGQHTTLYYRPYNATIQGLEFTDRSIAATTFNTGQDIGIFADYRHKIAGNVTMRGKAAITMGEGRNWWFAKSNSGLSYIGRVEVYPFGWFKGGGDRFEGDLLYEETPKLIVGLGYCYNDRAVRLNGQSGSIMPDNESRTLRQYYLDLFMKYRGFSFATDFMGRNCDNPLFESNSTMAVFTGKGLNVQASYVFPHRWSLAMRNATVFVDEEIRSVKGYKRNNQTSLSLIKYIVGHNVKAIAEASHYHRKEAVDAYTRWTFRFQLEVGI